MFSSTVLVQTHTHTHTQAHTDWTDFSTWITQLRELLMTRVENQQRNFNVPNAGKAEEWCMVYSHTRCAGMGWDGMGCTGNSMYFNWVTSAAHPIPSHPSAACVWMHHKSLRDWGEIAWRSKAGNWFQRNHRCVQVKHISKAAISFSPLSPPAERAICCASVTSLHF